MGLHPWNKTPKNQETILCLIENGISPKFNKPQEIQNTILRLKAALPTPTSTMEMNHMYLILTILFQMDLFSPATNTLNINQNSIIKEKNQMMTLVKWKLK